jgi:hypothetical protein
MAAMALLPRQQRGHPFFFMFCCINFGLISASECVFVCYFAGGQDLKTEPENHPIFLMYCCINFELIPASECVFVCCFAGRQDQKT